MANSSPSLVCEEYSGKANRKRLLILFCIALSAITVFVYWQVGDHEFINYDDNDYVYNNLHVVEGITGPNIIWAFISVDAANWHPITWLSHMADVQFYGMNPRGHHLTNVAIHTASTVLLFVLLFRLTSSLWKSAFVAALFALHPLHVQSVAWVAERKDVLSAFFWFLTMLLYASYVAKQKPVFYFLSLISFTLGLMAKPMLITLPVVMLLVDYWPFNRGHLKEQNPGQLQLQYSVTPLMALLKEKIPFFACSLLSAAVTIYAHHKGEAIVNLDSVPLGLRIENSIIAYVTYLTKTIWPHDLAILYPYPSSFPLWQVICSFLILFFVSASTIWAGRRHPYLVVGWFWFLVTLVPVIGLVQVGAQSMADRYTYIPLIGIFIVSAWGVSALTKKLLYRQSILALLAGTVMVASVAVTWRQLGYWRDSISIFRHALQVTSDNSLAHNNVGAVLYGKGDLDAAIKEYREALAISPNFLESRVNLGLALYRKGDLDAAIKEYQEALKINPNDFETHYDLGIALGKKGDLDAAIKEYQEALKINPNFVLAQRRLRASLPKADFNKAQK